MGIWNDSRGFVSGEKWKTLALIMAAIILPIGLFYFFSPEYSNGPMHPRGPGLNLTFIVNCLESGIDSEIIEVNENEYGQNLNSDELRAKFLMDELCRSYADTTLTAEEREKTPSLPRVAFDERVGRYVDELGHPLYIVYFGDKTTGYTEDEINRLAKRYRMAVWIVGTDGVNRYGRSVDGKFLGITRDGIREFERTETVWWRFWN